MQFELKGPLLDDIVFSMEDQEGTFFLDTAEGVVTRSADYPGAALAAESGGGGKGGPRFIPLPRWDSASGYRLMERFVSGLRNPPLRKELTSALGQGKGVFRAFKDILGRYPEAGKLWFYFKQKEMKREITRWYNGLREEWGLEKIGEEPEDTGDLVLEDFRFRPFGKEDRARAGELRRFCLDEARQILAEKGAANPAGILPGAGSPAPLPDSFFETAPDAPGAALAAESGGGEFAGYIFGTIKEKTLRIHNLEVKPEYRGLGIGEALLARLLKSLNPDEVRAVTLDLPSWMEGFSRVIERESFKPLTVRYFLNLPPGTNCY